MIESNDFRIRQVFSDVLTSEKGVVKLIKSNGSEFIFTANLIKSIGKCKKVSTSNNIYHIISSIFEDNNEIYAYIELGGKYKEQGYILICQDYDYVNRKLLAANEISCRIDELKTGKFS